jgi:hypothetical protein
MKLTVLVPSDDYRSSAGARIRYGGIAQGLSGEGIALELESIASFDPATADCDALLISKCHDARSVLAAAVLSRRGKLVGVDLFDDYFSQTEDSRLIRYRDWLADLLQECDFCLCSTEAIAGVVRSYSSDVSTHVVNDPAREHSVDAVLRAVQTKLEEANSTGVIQVAWFGVGDNPYFDVGLTDLFAHSSALSDLTHGGKRVNLTVLTNRRALRADRLELMSRLPVPYNIMEWSEALERDVLDRSLLAFLPVSAQRFSSAKSLNRAFTAFSHGCQVLSVGHPLYAALEPLVYRDARSLLSDLSHGTLRLSASHSALYREKLQALGSAEVEALRLSEFLKSLIPSPAREDSRLCVVHGLSTRAEVHHLTRSLRGLSVASPYCSADLDFDVSFRGQPPEMTMVVDRQPSPDVPPSANSKSHRESRIGRGTFLNLPSRSPQRAANKPPAGSSLPVSYQLATYSRSIREIERQLKEVFGPIRLIISETSRLPVSGS